MRRIFLVFLLFFVSCMEDKGEFGWAVLSPTDDILEKKFNTVTEYKVMREQLVFSPGKRIFFIFRFLSGGFGKEYFVSLSKKKMNFYEIDFKRISPFDGRLATEYIGLGEGEYQIRVANDDGNLIDEVLFRVVPEEGYVSEEEIQENVEDEIIYYSRMEPES